MTYVSLPTKLDRQSPRWLQRLRYARSQAVGLLNPMQGCVRKHSIVWFRRVETFNIVDDSLIKDVIRQNELTQQTASRVGDYVRSAELAGADQILVTCSSIGRAG